MNGLLIAAVVILLQVVLASCDGRFYVGLLGYSTSGSDVCCDNVSGNESCTTFCRLVFEVHVHGLNGSNDVTTFRLTPDPISPSEAATFQTTQSLHNPLTFTFVKWPGGVNISVNVFNQFIDNDKEILEPVDTFSSAFERYKPENFYILRDIKAAETNSILKIVYRYDCAPTKGPACFKDCIDHDDDEPCPLTSPTPVVPEVTFTGFTEKCETKDKNGSVVYMNCTVSSKPTTEPTKKTSSKRPYLDSGPTPSPKQGNSTSDVIPKTTSQSTTPSTTTTSTTTTVTSTTSRATSTQSRLSTPSDDPKPSVNPNPTPGTTPDERLSKTDEEDKIIEDWPFIVGGVLGGVAVIAAVGFCLYYRRQKKLLKRQEIYNVNPKILRNFEEYAENGTSGRADVPLETEQY